MKRIATLYAAVGLGMTALATSALAAVPASVGTTMTALSADASDIFDLVFPVVGVVVGLVIIVKLFKRFANKI